MALHIQKFTFNDFQENTYVVYNENSCVIIDPGCYEPHEKEEIIDFMEKNNFNLILEEENETGLDMYERRFTFKRKNFK